MLGGISGNFWTGEGQRPQFWPGKNVFMVAKSGLKMSSIKPHVCVHCKASEQVECPLVFGQGGEHDFRLPLQQRRFSGDFSIF